MNMILVDYDIILDTITEDINFYHSSAQKLYEMSKKFSLCINIIIYSEISFVFKNINELEKIIPKKDFTRLNLPWNSAFIGSKMFNEYKKNNNYNLIYSISNFYIGAHASISNIPILTRNINFYNEYFKNINIIN